MTRAFILTVAVLVGLLVAAPSNAGSYGYGYGGYGNYHGYHGNFYYYPTLPTYYAQSYYQPSYNYGYTPSYSSGGVDYYDGNYHTHSAGTYNGVWYPAGQYAWKNGQWVGQNSQLAVPVAPKDWKTELLKVAEKRDEYAAYAAALRALGVSPPPAGGFTPPPGVGMGGGYGVNMNTNLGTYGAQGTSLYGYQSVRELYGDANISTLYQQAAQLAQNAQALGGEAAQQFQASVSREGENRSRVAEILARSQAAATALRAAQGSESHQSMSITRVEPQGPPADQGPPRARLGNANQPPADPAFVKLASETCLRCHDSTKQDGNKFEGRFDLRAYPTMSLKEKVEKVIPRLMLPESDEKHMPKGGKSLNPAEIRLFLSN